MLPLSKEPFINVESIPPEKSIQLYFYVRLFDRRKGSNQHSGGEINDSLKQIRVKQPLFIYIVLEYE